VIVSFGIGFCYFPPLICGWEWIPERKGLVTGIILGAFGFGSFVFGFISMYICNPDNESPVPAPNGSKFYSQAVALRVPSLLKTLALSWFFLALVAVLLVKRNPAM